MCSAEGRICRFRLFSLSGIGKSVRTVWPCVWRFLFVDKLRLALHGTQNQQVHDLDSKSGSTLSGESGSIAVNICCSRELLCERPKEHEVRIDFALRHLRGVMAAIIFTAHPCEHASVTRRPIKELARIDRSCYRKHGFGEGRAYIILGDAFTSYIAM